MNALSSNDFPKMMPCTPSCLSCLMSVRELTPPEADITKKPADAHDANLIECDTCEQPNVECQEDSFNLLNVNAGDQNACHY